MFHRPRGLRTALSSLFALSGISAACLCSAQATTSITATSNVHTTSNTEWSDTLSVAPFDTTLGTLASVTITLNWNAYQTMTATNADVSDEYIYSMDQTNVNLTLPNGNPVLSGASPTIGIGSLVNSGGTLYPTYDLAAGATVTATPISTASTSSVTLTDAADLATFSGAANIAFPVATKTNVSQQEIGGNINWSITTQSGASVTVTYSYTPKTQTIPKTACIKGTVWNNQAGDGRCGHVTETGLGAGIKINVFDATGALVGTATTKADGTYEVDGLLPSTTYKVTIDTTTLPANFRISCKSISLCVTTPATGCAVSADFTGTPVCKEHSYTTLCQDDWSDTSNCDGHENCLHDCWKQVYPSDRECHVGGNDAKCTFDNSRCVEDFMGQDGSCKSLPKGCKQNPRGWDDCGRLSGETLACKLNCDFSDAGCFKTGFKDLTCQSGKFKGCKVSDVLHAGQCFLNGDKEIPNVPKCSISDITNCLHSINCSYRNSGDRNGNGGSGFCK